MTSVASLLTKILSIIFFFVKRRKKAGDAFVAAAKIASLMRNIVMEESYEHLDIERCLILRAHNSGEDLTPLSYMFTSVMMEAMKEPFDSVFDQYQKIAIDTEYRKLVADIYVNKMVTMETSSMPDCRLKNFYISEGVVRSKCFFIKHNKKELWFMSFATSKDNNSLGTPEHTALFDISVSRVRELLKKF